MMTSIRAGIAILFALLALSVNAAPITYEFTVTAINGPLTGVSSTGTFTFDSSSIVPGGDNNAAGLITDLSFSWNGVHYDESEANTGLLSFDALGGLTGFAIGNNCAAGTCMAVNEEENWFIYGGGFFYTVGDRIPYSGPITVRRVTVPEPAPLALIALALALVGIGRRRATLS